LVNAQSGTYNSPTMEAQPLTFALIDESSGYEASPERVRLASLAEFSADVAMLLRGSAREVDPAKLEVAVQFGSVAIRTAPVSLAPVLFRDLRSLLDSESLDRLDVRRREVLERWQKTARLVRGIAYRISAPFLERPILVNAESDYRADDADQWVQVERYVQGQIEDLGGAPRANVLAVGTERDVLRDDPTNRLYKQAMLRIKAEYNVLTRELRKAKLVEFVEYAPKFDEADMARLTRRGAQAWKDVPDATAWVEDLRGERN
jgi:hypothetical protein